YDRRRELHRLQNNRMAFDGDRVAGGHILEAADSDYLACECLFHILTLVGVHTHNAADALSALLGRIEHVRACLEVARIDAREGELADMLVGKDLEYECSKRRLVVWRALLFLLRLRVKPDHGRYIE